MFEKIKKWRSLKPKNANKLAKKEQLKHAAVLLLVAGVSYGFYCYSKTDYTKRPVQEEAHFDGVFDSQFNQASDEALLEQQQHQIDDLKELVSTHEKKQTQATLEPDSDTKALVAAMQEKLVQLEDANKKPTNNYKSLSFLRVKLVLLL